MSQNWRSRAYNAPPNTPTRKPQKPPLLCPECQQPVTRTSQVGPAYDPGFPPRIHPCDQEHLDMTDDPFDAGSQSDMEQIKRDHYGRPLIVPAEGGKPTPYQRVTTFIKAVDDTAGLDLWKQRQVAIGLSRRPDLQLAVQSLAPGVINENSDDKKALNGICKEAMEAAGSSSKATIGTALHRLTERHDRGETFDVPAVAAADLEAYKRATAGFTWLHIERMTVHDGLKVAGTPDRIALVDGIPVICDLKTGASLWPHSHAMQLGVYANSLLYDIKTGRRQPLDVDTRRGLVIHLPAGTGRCDLVWVDTAAGWEAAQLAAQVKTWRARRDLSENYVSPTVDFLGRSIAAASTVEELTALWRDNTAQWSDAHSVLAKARKAELTAAADPLAS